MMEMLIISVVHTRTVSSYETRSFAVARCEMYAKYDVTSVYSPTSLALLIYKPSSSAAKSIFSHRL